MKWLERERKLVGLLTLLVLIVPLIGALQMVTDQYRRSNAARLDISDLQTGPTSQSQYCVLTGFVTSTSPTLHLGKFEYLPVSQASDCGIETAAAIENDSRTPRRIILLIRESSLSGTLAEHAANGIVAGRLYAGPRSWPEGQLGEHLLRAFPELEPARYVVVNVDDNRFSDIAWSTANVTMYAAFLSMAVFGWIHFHIRRKVQKQDRANLEEALFKLYTT